MIKPATLALAVLTAICTASMVGCNRYQVTLNERVVSEPPGLLRDIVVVDPQLQLCIDQTIIDQHIHRIDGLDTLVCTNGGINTLDGIEALNKVHTLNLANNNLTSITPLLFLGDLRAVNLTDNPKLDCHEVEKLRAHLPKNGTLMVPSHCQK